ncbi:uncharacterized protein LOC127568161 [Pristis pectinata]|uniref:uncharacterized protein LOC127568161 n=1 Tax=Pristis pectinata TaxID=685728 RepID=UPI00223D799C|nr:uncharacterized protein LOC127568161 [Pristis pectinata]
MQEVTLVQGIASAAVEQELKPVAAPEGDRQPLPLAECQGVDESMTATTVSKDGALLVEEVSPEKVEIVREQTLEAEETEVVREQSVKIVEEGDQEELRAMVSVTEKVGAEQIAECRKTEVVPAHAASKDEAVMERVGATISEVAQQVGVERVEAAAVEDTEDVSEVGAEKALAERTEDAGVPEIPVEQSVETRVKVEQSVTEAVSIEETGQISPPAGVSQVETSEEHVEVTPAVSVTEVLPGEGAVKTIAVELTKVESCVEPSRITSAVGVTEVVCGEEITQITPVGITEVVLGEEPIEIIPVVGVAEAVCSEETTEITPVGVIEAVLGEEPIEISPKVDVTEVMCRGIGEISPGEATEMVRSEETTELAPVGVTEAVLRQEPTEITPAAGVTGAICSEETTELTPVRVAEALLGKDPIEIIPAAGVTETLVGEETIELTPVGVTEALLGEEPIEIPVGVTEVVCSEETTEITPVGVTEAVLGEEPIEITPAVEVTEVTCRGIEIAPEGATAAVCGEKTTEITPVEVMEIISGEQPAGRSPLGVTEVVPGKEPIDVAPPVGVTEVVCGKETTEITPAVVLESLPSEEPMRITPTVGMTEAVCGEETTELAPLGVTKVIPSEEAFGITHVTVTKVLSEETVKVSSVDLSEALPGEEQIAVTPVGVTEVCGEDSIEVAAVVHSEVADAASAEAGVEESKSEREGEAPRQGANEEDVQKVMDSEAAQEQLTPVEIIQQDMGAEIVETAMDEAVCEELVESPKGQRTQEALADSLGLVTQILQSTTTEGPSKETNETTTTKVAGTEVKSETVCDELEGMKSVQPAAEETDTTLATVSRDQGEISPGEHPEKSLTEAAETQAGEASAAKQVETGATCVTSELLSATSEGTTLEQALDVVEPAEEVECKLASEERDKPAPDESIEKISLKAGELGRGDQPAVTSQVQSVSVPKPCQHIEGAAELQSDVELKSSSSDSLVKEQPLSLSDPQTPVGFSKEKCEVDAETICPTLESAPEVKLHVASVDEFQVLQNEMVILMEDLPVVKSSESCEEAFLVTVSSVEEKVIAETVTTVSAEILEPSAVDQVLPPCEDVKQVSIVETAAVIVETAIEVATGCMSSTPDDSETVLTTDVQEAESCRKERLEDQLAECKIKETVTQKLECLETRTEVEVSQTQTFEQQSAQAAQVLSQDPLVLTQLQGQESTKEEEKLLRLQKDTAIEGTSEVVDQRFQTSGNQDFEGKESVLMQSAEMVLETTVRGGQESIETETLASMHTELGRESSDDTSGNISISSEVTRAECCQSLEQPEATRPSIELTKQTQLVTIQQIGEEQSSLHGAQGGMISLTGELANENEVEAVQLNREAMDQSQSVGTDEKQSHEVETEPSVELAKGAAERTPS